MAKRRKKLKDEKGRERRDPYLTDEEWKAVKQFISDMRGEEGIAR